MRQEIGAREKGDLCKKVASIGAFLGNKLASLKVMLGATHRERNNWGRKYMVSLKWKKSSSPKK